MGDGIGAIAGPFIASNIMTWSNAAGLFAFTGIVHLALVAFVGYRMLRRESAPDEAHMSFGDALATAHTASQVYEEEIHQQADEEDMRTTRHWAVLNRDDGMRLAGASSESGSSARAGMLGRTAPAIPTSSAPQASRPTTGPRSDITGAVTPGYASP